MDWHTLITPANVFAAVIAMAPYLAVAAALIGAGALLRRVTRQTAARLARPDQSAD